MTETQAAYDCASPTDWICRRCGAVLGTIERGKSLHKLQIRNILITGRADVTCQSCGTVREWFADAEAIKRLVDLAGKKRD